MAREEMRESPSGMSMYGIYQTCPRQWAFKYGLGFMREGIKPHQLVHGSAVHEGKKIFYVNHDIQEAINRSIEVVREYEESFDSLTIEERRIEELFTEWDKVYGQFEKEKYTVLSNETQEIIVLLNGAEITLRIDQVLRENETGHIYIFDTKTTAWSLEGTIAEYEFKAQPLLYVSSVYKTNPWWLSDFRGWITDVIYQRVNYRRDGSLSSISTKCQRSPAIMYTEEQCQAFLESLTSMTSDVAWAYSSFIKGAPFNACFPMNRSSCRNWNRTCPYWHICFQNFTHDSAPPPPYTLDPWKEEGVIEDVMKKIKF